MTRLERYYLLGLFGGGAPLRYFDMIQIGTLHLANPINTREIYVGSPSFRGKKSYQAALQGMIKEALESGLIKRIENDNTKALRLNKAYLIEPEDFSYQLTLKGDNILRYEQMARQGDPFYYLGFKRDPNDTKHADNILENPDDKSLE